jgi:DNA-binding FrmR family transcriptional regulator
MNNQHASSPDVISRLSKIEGHVRGIVKMVEQHKPCNEILLQISAIQAAISKVGEIVLTNHIEECIVSKIEDKEIKKNVRLFKDAMSRLIR